ncbi:MAG: transcription antitermination factor NusB [Acutalibacteraceae bacterium]|nr:transcription antitermination factor NusB [Acutalibacteraceae bacterium]
MNRKSEREQAFLIIFEKQLNNDDIEYIINNAIETGIYEENDFSKKEILGTFSNLQTIDDTISQNLKNWSISRLSKVSLAVLRLAVYEIIFEKEIPNSVSINEAVELAKKYGAEDDAKYVNGVLGSIVKQ